MWYPYYGEVVKMKRLILGLLLVTVLVLVAYFYTSAQAAKPLTPPGDTKLLDASNVRNIRAVTSVMRDLPPKWAAPTA